MKKWFATGVAILIIYAIFSSSGALFERISIRNVERIQLWTSDGFTSYETDLTGGECEKFVSLYNRSKHGGDVDEKPPREKFHVLVKVAEDREITVGEGVRDYLIITTPEGEQYYLENAELIEYIWELIRKYNLPTEVG